MIDLKVNQLMLGVSDWRAVVSTGQQRDWTGWVAVYVVAERGWAGHGALCWWLRQSEIHFPRYLETDDGQIVAGDE